MHRPCVIIPTYNNPGAIGHVLNRLEDIGLPCFIVNDGSVDSYKAELDEEAASRDWVQVRHLNENRGKGAAVGEGMFWVEQEGFTHAVQVDADGQHRVEDTPEFLAVSRDKPKALVLGTPVFSEDVPKARLYGRQLSRFWVWVETLSRDIDDPLFGFRIYPVEATCKVLRNPGVGLRMDFDPEIAVRLFWAGTPVENVRTPVSYPEGGVSHFRMFRDNVAISWMHTRLVVGMLLRSPKFLFRKGRG